MADIRKTINVSAKLTNEQLNMLKEAETIGIDYYSENADTFDAGMHLNLNGAEKLSEWFGNYLKANTALGDRRTESHTCVIWQEKEDYYEEMKNAQYTQLREEGKLTGYWG